MKAYKQWKEKRAIKTIGWLNNSSAYIAGEEAGWRAALEEVLEQIEVCNSDGSIIVWIKGELNDEN